MSHPTVTFKNINLRLLDRQRQALSTIDPWTTSLTPAQMDAVSGIILMLEAEYDERVPPEGGNNSFDVGDNKLTAMPKPETGGLPEFPSIARKEVIQQVLRQGVCELVFTKNNGDERQMTCTLHPNFLPEIEESANPDKKSSNDTDDTVTVWDVDADGWRRFRIDALTQFPLLVASGEEL